MKKTTLLFVFVLSSLAAQAQQVWNKKLPAPNLATTFSVGYARPDGDGFLLAASNQFLELNWEGTVSGRGGNSSPTLWLSNYLQKRIEPVSGSPYFLMGWRTTQNMPYTLAYYKPNEGGWKPGLTFGLGELGNYNARGPAIQELSSTSLLVFTQSFVRKIACPGDTLWIEWEKPIAVSGYPNAAAQKNTAIAFVTNKGEIAAVNVNGDPLWTRTYSNYVFRSIVATSDGFLASGSDNNLKAAMVKLAPDGTLLWEKIYSTDQEYNAVCTTLDGSIAVTGKSAEGNIPLAKLSANGDLIWRKTYQKGNGTSILATNDAGFFITAGSTQSGYFAIKTAADGEITDLDSKALYREGYLSNGGFALTQSPSSSLFFNNTNSGLLVPADHNTSTIFSFCPWLAGTDPGDNLHLSVSSYGELYGSDYALGISNGPANDFDRVWSITRVQIALLKEDFGADGDLDSPVPNDLLTWPAKGNIHFRQNLDFTTVTTNPDAFPAPFMDKNGDGIYNVYDGDYPVLKGDRMMWWAITDQAVHAESNGTPLNVDIAISAYGYDCPENQPVYQSVFVDYKIINRSATTYHDAYLGFFTDFDLGCSDDDFIGSIPDANSFYVYNQDAVDGQPGGGCAGNVPTFDEAVPVESITLLNQELQHFTYLNRGGGGGPAATTDPVSPAEFLNYMQGKWRDGSPLTIGGTGFNPNDPNAIPTNFAFADDPNDPQGWTMCTGNLPYGDRRTVASHGPFNFAAGDTFSIQLACTFHPNIPHPCPNIAGLVEPTIKQVQDWHDSGALDKQLDLGGVQTLSSGQSLTLDATQADPATGYVWSTGATTSSITVTQPGQYTVTVTPSSGCSYTETVFVKLSSGLHTPVELASWQVQPNPCSEVMQIRFEQVDTPVMAQLRNAQGQLVATAIASGTSLAIAVGNLPSGFYWAELWNDGKSWGSRKVIIAQ